nr:MAG: nonstructural protein [Microviridae sp.]
MSLYVIYDTLAEESGPILECKNDHVAVRAYKRAMENTRAGTNAEYWLYYVGNFDNVSMVLNPEKPRRIEINNVEVKDVDE